MYVFEMESISAINTKWADYSVFNAGSSWYWTYQNIINLCRVQPVRVDYEDEYMCYYYLIIQCTKMIVCML